MRLVTSAVLAVLVAGCTVTLGPSSPAFMVDEIMTRAHDICSRRGYVFDTPEFRDCIQSCLPPP